LQANFNSAKSSLAYARKTKQDFAGEEDMVMIDSHLHLGGIPSKEKIWGNFRDYEKLAKKMGCKIFDFEGIYDDRFPLKSWLGFSRFKKSFGGLEVEYPGAYSKFLLPF